MGQTTDRKNTIAWVIRIIIFALFLVSAVAKLYKSIIPLEPSIWGFEKQLVDLGICDWCLSHYFARIIIGIELALAFAILQPHLLKKVVIPITIALLAAFCIHLGIQMVEYGPMNGNCGCFGELIPMTPLEAFIKNIITIGLLVWLYRLLQNKRESWRNMINLIAIFLACVLLIFILFPFCPCDDEPRITIPPITDTSGTLPPDTLNDTIKILPPDTLKQDPAEKQRIKDSIKKAEDAAKAASETAPEKVVEKGPKPIVSRFAQLPTFSGKTIKVDEGKKTICMFAPGCDHCQNTAKALFELSKKGDTPPVYIYFMDEERERIPEFFKIAGTNFPYQVLSIGNFWDLLGDGSTPGVFGLWNGNIMQSYEGINENEFDMKKFKEFALPK